VRKTAAIVLEARASKVPEQIRHRPSDDILIALDRHPSHSIEVMFTRNSAVLKAIGKPLALKFVRG